MAANDGREPREVRAHLVHNFDEVYELTSPVVFAFCLRILGNRDDAADALQQTYVNAWKARHRFRGDARVTSWLLTIARRTAFRILRRRPTRTDSAVLEEVPGDERRPDERIAVEQALTHLPARMRAAVMLYYIHDMSVEETARIMGVAAGTVKAHLHTGRTRLRRLLE